MAEGAVHNLYTSTGSLKLVLDEFDTSVANCPPSSYEMINASDGLIFIKSSRTVVVADPLREATYTFQIKASVEAGSSIISATTEV